MKNSAKKTTTKSNKSNNKASNAKAKPAKKLAVVATEDYKEVSSADKIAIRAAVKDTIRDSGKTKDSENANVKALLPLSINVMRSFLKSGKVVEVVDIKKAILYIGGHPEIADRELPKRIIGGNINPEWTEKKTLYGIVNGRLNIAIYGARLIVNYGPIFAVDKNGNIKYKNGSPVVKDVRKGWQLDDYGNIVAPMNTLIETVAVKNDLGKTMKTADGTTVQEKNTDVSLQHVSVRDLGMWLSKMEPGSRKKRETTKKKTSIDPPSHDVTRIAEDLSGVKDGNPQCVLDLDHNRRTRLAKLLRALQKSVPYINDWTTKNNVPNNKLGGDIANMALVLEEIAKAEKKTAQLVSPKKKDAA